METVEVKIIRKTLNYKGQCLHLVKGCNFIIHSFAGDVKEVRMMDKKPKSTARQEQIIRNCTQGRITKDEAIKQLKESNNVKDK